MKREGDGDSPPGGVPPEGQVPKGDAGGEQKGSGGLHEKSETLRLSAAELRAMARAYMENRVQPPDFAAAKKVLDEALNADSLDPTGETRYLLGLACFHLEDWDAAEIHMRAVLRNPQSPYAQLA